MSKITWYGRQAGEAALGERFENQLKNNLPSAVSLYSKCVTGVPLQHEDEVYLSYLLGDADFDPSDIMTELSTKMDSERDTAEDRDTYYFIMNMRDAAERLRPDRSGQSGDPLQAVSDAFAQPFFRSAKDLLAEDIPPQKWLIEGLIAEDQVGLLAAPRKIGKSWMCLQIALAIASGQPFFGKAVNAAGVLYCDLESTKRRPRSRLSLLTAGNIPDSLSISVSGEIRRIDEGFEEQIRLMHSQRPDIKLVILDVLQKVLPPIARNADRYEYSYRVIGDTLKRLAEELHIAFLVVTHTRKSTAVSSGDPFDEVIGSTGMVSAADNIYVIHKNWKSGETTMHTTGKDIEGEDLAIELRDCTWRLLGNMEDMELQRQRDIYIMSPVTKTIIKLVDQGSGVWEGTVDDIVQASAYLGSSIDDDVRKVGKFIEDNKGFFWAEHHINIEPDRNGKSRKKRFSKKE